MLTRDDIYMLIFFFYPCNLTVRHWFCVPGSDCIYFFCMSYSSQNNKNRSNTIVDCLSGIKMIDNEMILLPHIQPTTNNQHPNQIENNKMLYLHEKCANYDNLMIESSLFANHPLNPFEDSQKITQTHKLFL